MQDMDFHTALLLERKIVLGALCKINIDVFQLVKPCLVMPSLRPLGEDTLTWKISTTKKSSTSPKAKRPTGPKMKRATGNSPGGGWGCKAGGETWCSRVQSRSPLGRSVPGREMRSGVTWERLGRLKTRRAVVFWNYIIYVSFLTLNFGSP